MYITTDIMNGYHELSIAKSVSKTFVSISNRTVTSPEPFAACAAAATADCSDWAASCLSLAPLRAAGLIPFGASPVSRACASRRPCAPRSWMRWASRTRRLKPPRQTLWHEDLQCLLRVSVGKQPQSPPGRLWRAWKSSDRPAVMPQGSLLILTQQEPQ